MHGNKFYRIRHSTKMTACMQWMKTSWTLAHREVWRPRWALLWNYVIFTPHAPPRCGHTAQDKSNILLKYATTNIKYYLWGYSTCTTQGLYNPWSTVHKSVLAWIKRSTFSWVIFSYFVTTFFRSLLTTFKLTVLLQARQEWMYQVSSWTVQMKGRQVLYKQRFI
jgi:hypothetical protein